MSAARSLPPLLEMGQLVPDRLATTGHADLWICVCRRCGARTARKLRFHEPEVPEHSSGWRPSCVSCRRELWRKIRRRRDLSKLEKVRLWWWHMHGSLYPRQEIERDTQANRNEVGEELGGWNSERIRKAPAVVPMEEVDEPSEGALSESFTLEEVAREIPKEHGRGNISRARVSQIEGRALGKLRKEAHSHLIERLRDCVKVSHPTTRLDDYENALIAAIDSGRSLPAIAVEDREDRYERAERLARDADAFLARMTAYAEERRAENERLEREAILRLVEREESRRVAYAVLGTVGRRERVPRELESEELEKMREETFEIWGVEWWGLDHYIQRMNALGGYRTPDSRIFSTSPSLMQFEGRMQAFLLARRRVGYVPCVVSTKDESRMLWDRPARELQDTLRRFFSMVGFVTVVRVVVSACSGGGS